MANPVWAPAIWVPHSWPSFPPEPPVPEPALEYDPDEPTVFQAADWTCSCASSAWILNSLSDDRFGRRWTEWDVVETLRAATYEGAVSPAYGLARADMADLQTMFESLGYTVERKQRVVIDDVLEVAGRYPLQINGARWYHHSGARALGPGVLYLANPSPTWRNVGQELTAQEAAQWGSWNALWLTGRVG